MSIENSPPAPNNGGVGEDKKGPFLILLPHYWGLGGLIFACLGVRLVALDADPPPWLSWSTGLYTDEGFYTLDARHEAVFGTAAPGDFHDRLLSPLLSALQQGVFSLFGAGIVQARLLSVLFGLLTVFVFWFGLRRAYGDRTADAGALLLGLAPPFVLYNRLALQETPTVFWLVVAFTLWTYGARQAVFYALASVSMAIALIFKGLAIVAVGALAVPRKMSLVFRAGGLLLGLALYTAVWYLPHQAELSRMGTYYRVHQMQPHSWHSLGLNLQRAFIKGERGVFPYLLLTVPVPFLLTGSGCLRRRGWSDADKFLGCWLLGGLLFCCISSYAPSRYYVLFLPPLMGLAARRLTECKRLQQMAAVTLFLFTSMAWYGVSWAECSYSQRDASRELARLLPLGSVVLGDFAPRLCLDTPFAATTVQPDLANDDHPVERLGATNVVVVRNARYWQNWWNVHYPGLLSPSRRIASFEFGGSRQYIVDVYRVKDKGNEGVHVENSIASPARADDDIGRRTSYSPASQIRANRPGLAARAAHFGSSQRPL